MSDFQSVIRIIVVAASPVIRMGLSAMLEDNPKFIVVKSVSDIDEIVELQADVILLDWNETDYELIKQQFIWATIIIVDEFADFNLATILAAGVKGILPQTSMESEIIAAVEAVVSGLIVLHPQVINNQQLLKETNLQILTPREIEVLQMLTNGMSNKLVAQNLHISEHTVKFHVSSIFQKLDVSTRTEAVAVGVRLGLIML
ncbi:response regulator transcription factor [Calothrix sp. CCY 0018]|uniref:response regulator transcription factor n=1 Tax=Calothrix sp. CCY 0018 TaxID=3103864 RepID=UPI0039C5C2E4